MGPKKAPGGAAGGDEDNGEDPLLLLQTYQKLCRAIALPAHPQVVSQLSNEEKYPFKQIFVDDEMGPLGPGGTRALMTAVMGGMGGPGMRQTKIYTLLDSIRLWRTNAGDDGTAAIAEVLRLGGSECKITYLEILNDNIGARGAMALGSALSYGNNLSLLTLKLDFNKELGTSGLAHLCRGLRTNSTLKNLYLGCCNITTEGGSHLAEVLSFNKSRLELLNVSGNKLGGAGLSLICKGLESNTVLESLCLADNMIESTEEGLAGIADLRDLLVSPTSALTSIDLLSNRIGEAGATILVPALGEENTRIKEFLVDLTLPMPLFMLIFRRPGGKKGKKGKGGGKKKKKK